MAGINQVIIIGRVGRDPEVKYLPDGTAVCRLSVATSEQWRDKETGEKKEATEWHRVVLWRRLAEIAGEYLYKGSQIYLEGKLQTKSWESNSGEKRYITEIVARQLQFLGNRGGKRGGGNWTPSQVPAGETEDLPF